MGTRHLIAVQVDGQYKIAQYGQWDGYPSGQGLTVLGFCRGMDRAKFAEQCRALQWISSEDLSKLWKHAGADDDGFIEYSKGQAFGKRYPEFSRDTGGKILQLVADSTVAMQLQNSITFAQDSLMCEYAYVIDLDAGTLEVFEGFNKAPLPDGARFKPEGNALTETGKNNYYPVKPMKTYQLDALPSDEQFLRDLEPQDDEEEGSQAALPAPDQAA